MKKFIWLVVAGIAVMLAIPGIGQSVTEEIEASEPLPPLPFPLVEPEQVPAAGTFYSAQREWPPLPGLMIPNLPVYLLASNVFVFDDRLVDYDLLQQEREAARQLRALAVENGMEAQFIAEFGEEAGLEGEGFNPPMMSMSFGSNDFYLEIICVTNDAAELVLHGTLENVPYLILSKEELTNVAWQAEAEVIGSTNQNWTPASIPVGERTNTLFSKPFH